jgi:hypothetical protein
VHTLGKACLPAGAARAPGGVLPRRWCKKELVECLSAFHCACIEDLFLSGVLCSDVKALRLPQSLQQPVHRGGADQRLLAAQDEPGLPGCFA